MTNLGINQLHDGLFQVVQVDGVLRWGSSNDIVIIVIITAECRKLLRIGELDINTVLLHDTLDASASDTDDAFVITFGDMKRDLGR
jgi:hypothetical protein